MNTSGYLLTGDAVSLTVTEAAYPFELEWDEQGNLSSNLNLQGRVVYADALGVCIHTTGGLIMPSANPDHDYMFLPTDNTRGEFFPWRSIDRVHLLQRSADYDTAWEWELAREEDYQDHHGGASVPNQRTYNAWAQTQDPAELRRRVGKIVDRVAELGR